MDIGQFNSTFSVFYFHRTFAVSSNIKELAHETILSRDKTQFDLFLRVEFSVIFRQADSRTYHAWETTDAERLIL